MWDVIFKVASGEVTLQLGVEDLVKSLPYSEIDALSDSEDQALRFCMTIAVPFERVVAHHCPSYFR